MFFGELVAGVEVAFGCGLASGGFDVDGLVAGGAAGGLVVGVGEKCGVAGAGCAVVVAADDGWAWADEVFFGGVLQLQMVMLVVIIVRSMVLSLV